MLVASVVLSAFALAVSGVSVYYSLRVGRNTRDIARIRAERERDRSMIGDVG